ncbi:hypothetical protein [Oceanimonas baumannii]|uniref:hypothetical protein n=1 Tax=Oceanimonas baumannii TaxID=129578 RepID=UPI0010669E3B|nr:hypothetical protein [Oceanimonas baumannii]
MFGWLKKRKASNKKQNSTAQAKRPADRAHRTIAENHDAFVAQQHNLNNQMMLHSVIADEASRMSQISTTHHHSHSSHGCSDSGASSSYSSSSSCSGGGSSSSSSSWD